MAAKLLPWQNETQDAFRKGATACFADTARQVFSGALKELKNRGVGAPYLAGVVGIDPQHIGRIIDRDQGMAPETVCLLGLAVYHCARALEPAVEVLWPKMVPLPHLMARQGYRCALAFAHWRRQLGLHDYLRKAGLSAEEFQSYGRAEELSAEKLVYLHLNASHHDGKTHVGEPGWEKALDVWLTAGRLEALRREAIGLLNFNVPRRSRDWVRGLVTEHYDPTLVNRSFAVKAASLAPAAPDEWQVVALFLANTEGLKSLERFYEDTSRLDTLEGVLGSLNAKLTGLFPDHLPLTLSDLGSLLAKWRGPWFDVDQSLSKTPGFKGWSPER